MSDTNLSIMFSGGLDSLIAYYFAVKKGYTPQCIWVDLGHPYANKEMTAMKNAVPSFISLTYLDFKNLYPAISHRLKNQIIPSRNLMLATIGAMFNDRVWINALDGEQNGKEHDKSERFFEDSTKLLSFLNEFFQQKTIVESPFATMTKTEIVTWALESGVPQQQLLDTTSCYDGATMKCGKCLTCFKRWAAFYANGIDEPGYEVHPLDGPYFQELLQEIPKAAHNMDFSRFTQKRIAEFYRLVELIAKENLRKLPFPLYQK